MEKVKTMKNSLYVIVNDDGEALAWDSSPWGDGESLICPIDYFTVFTEKPLAERALRATSKYAKKEKLYSLWKVKDWAVISLEDYLESER